MPYIGFRNNSQYMMLRYNYARRDWVFFEKVTIAVDDDRYYKFFNYYDITHDTGGGMVGEWIDESASSRDIEMLREIVTSKKTIVRFEGDYHYYDYTLTDSDKSGIKDVLIIWDYLNR